MANQLLTISMITPESARVLSNNLVLAQCVNRSFDQDFGVRGAKIGQTVNVRKPARYTVRTGSVVDLQAQTETYAPLVFSNSIGVDLDFTSQEKTFSLDMYSNNVIKPAVKRLANAIDQLGYSLVPQFFNSVGTPGTALTAANSQLNCLNNIAMLYNNDAPVGSEDIHTIVNPAFNAILASSAASLFNPSQEISDIFVQGYFGRFGGSKFYMSQLMPNFTNGAYGGSPVTNSATPQTGSSLITDGWTSGATTLNAGTIFTIAGVYAVNPNGAQTLTYLQQFTVVTTVSDTAGAITATISPAIVASGPFQNVSNAAANTQAITVVGATGATGQQALSFHKDAIMLANKDLEVPRAGIIEGFYIREEQSNIGVRIIESFDVRTDQWITRADTMVAWAPLYAQLASRLYTA